MSVNITYTVYIFILASDVCIRVYVFINIILYIIWQYAGMTYSTRFEKTLKDYDIEHETRAKLEQTNAGRDVTDNDEDKSENHDGEKTVGSTEVPVQGIYRLHH